MEIFGIGGWELLLLLIIMLVVAGPKRMIRWSYVLGVWVGRLRMVWSDTAKALQRELDDAGVDVRVPTNIPTRGDLQREIGRAMSPVTQPLRETLDEARKPDETQKPDDAPAAPPNTNGGFGTWGKNE